MEGGGDGGFNTKSHNIKTVQNIFSKNGETLAKKKEAQKNTQNAKKAETYSSFKHSTKSSIYPSI